MLGKELLKKTLNNLIDSIDAGNSDYSEKECMEIVNTINQLTNVENRMSKYQAYTYLGMSRATFDNYVKMGIIPEGTKTAGFKEKSWTLKQLKDVEYKLKSRR